MACLDIPIIAATSLMLFLSSRSVLFSCSCPAFANQITPLPIISRTARIRSSPLRIHSTAPISSFPITYHCISAFLSCLFFAFSALSSSIPYLLNSMPPPLDAFPRLSYSIPYRFSWPSKSFLFGHLFYFHFCVCQYISSNSPYLLILAPCALDSFVVIYHPFFTFAVYRIGKNWLGILLPWEF